MSNSEYFYSAEAERFSFFHIPRALMKDARFRGLRTEIRFPEMGVRFIAVNDGVDSDNAMSDDFTPFRNIINDNLA